MRSTGRSSAWPSKTSTSRRPRLSGMAISWTHVTPRDAARPAARSWASWITRPGSDSKYHSCAMAFASPRRRPVASPASSRSTPSSPSTVAAPSAAVFTTLTYPSARTNRTGRWGASASSSARVGSLGSDHIVSSNPWASAGSEPGCARIFSSAFSLVRAPERSRPAMAIPVPDRWTWASTKPGTIVVPGSSTVRSAGGGAPIPTRSTCRSSTRTHSPSGGKVMVRTRVARYRVFTRRGDSTGGSRAGGTKPLDAGTGLEEIGLRPRQAQAQRVEGGVEPIEGLFGAPERRGRDQVVVSPPEEWMPAESIVDRCQDGVGHHRGPGRTDREPRVPLAPPPVEEVGRGPGGSRRCAETTQRAEQRSRTHARVEIGDVGAEDHRAGQRPGQPPRLPESRPQRLEPPRWPRPQGPVRQHRGRQPWLNGLRDRSGQAVPPGFVPLGQERHAPTAAPGFRLPTGADSIDANRQRSLPRPGGGAADGVSTPAGAARLSPGRGVLSSPGRAGQLAEEDRLGHAALAEVLEQEALVGPVGATVGVLHTDEEDGGVGEPVGELLDEGGRTAGPDLHRVGPPPLAERPACGLEHRPLGLHREGPRRGPRRHRHPGAPRRVRFEVAHQRGHGPAGVLARGQPEADLGPGRGDQHVPGLADPRRVDPQHRHGWTGPQPLGQPAVSDRLNAVEDPGLLPELGLGQVEGIGGPAAGAVDRHLPSVVMGGGGPPAQG